jgi:ribosomal protein S18 acetylase RimI-like enzyme
MTFRRATIDDSSAVAGLLTQLGYPTTPAEMKGRLGRLLSQPDYATFVAEQSAGQVVGLVGAYLGYALEFDARYGRLTGLVVDTDWRSQGLGKALMHHVHVWLKSHGVSHVTLTSGNHRLEAHAFYQAIGYQATGVRFAKQL